MYRIGAIPQTHYSSLIHSIANFSESTLSAGARIIDRIVQYASPEMQNWEFLKEVEDFKKDLLSRTDLSTYESTHYIDSMTDKFLENRGIIIKTINEEEDVD